MVTLDASNVMPTSIVPLIDPALDHKLVCDVNGKLVYDILFH